MEGLSYQKFVVARLIRLYPVYLLGMLASIFVGLAVAHRFSTHGFFVGALLGLLLLPDVFHGSKAAMYPFNFPAWSLLCELLSNIGYAALVVWRGTGQWLLYPTIGACALFMALWVRGSGTVDSGSVLQTFPMGLARVGYSFGAGVLVFRYLQARPRARLTGFTSWLLAGTVCTIVVAALATRVTQAPVSQLVTVLLVFPMVIYCGALTTITGRLSKVAAFLGDTSYPIYLLHMPFFTFFTGRRMHGIALHHPQAKPLIAFISFALLLALSWAVAKWFDLSLRRFLTTRFHQRPRYAA